jgi:hypothetical protein
MPAQRRQLMKARPFAWAGGAGALAVLLIALVWLPGPLADLREYRAAPECRTAGPAEGCRTVAPATVTGVEDHVPGGKRKYRLTLRLADGSESVLTMAGAGGSLDSTPGDEAVAVLWRGSVVEVRQGRDRDAVDGSRLLAWRPPVMLGSVLAPVTLAVLFTAGWLALRQRKLGRAVEAQDALPPVTFWLAAALVVAACAPIGFSALGPEDVLIPLVWLCTGVTVVAAPFAAWLSVRPRREQRETQVLPVTPTGENVVTGRVIGDVPYSKEGFDRLVVGPGLLAATPDPTGRVARVRVPALRVTRVRESGGVCVAECQDGDREVLIVAEIGDMPAVLGALQPASA